MKKTEILGLNLMEASDVLSAKPLNENTAAIDELLGAVIGKTSSVVRMATDSYKGNGSRSVTIQTPGFVPKFVVMRSKQEHGYTLNDAPRVADRLEYMQGPTVNGGWALWMGSDMTGQYYESETERRYDSETGEWYDEVVGYTEKTAPVTFTAAEGSLKWSMADTAAPARLVNNASGVTYEWVAFGTVEE
jgi:hypothetical protein